MKDMVGSSTRLLLIRPSSVTLLDFWEGSGKRRDKMVTTDKKFDAPKSTITEVLGKRRLGRESTKGKKRCCPFC